MRCIDCNKELEVTSTDRGWKYESCDCDLNDELRLNGRTSSVQPRKREVGSYSPFDGEVDASGNPFGSEPPVRERQLRESARPGAA